MRDLNPKNIPGSPSRLRNWTCPKRVRRSRDQVPGLLPLGPALSSLASLPRHRGPPSCLCRSPPRTGLWTSRSLSSQPSFTCCKLWACVGPLWTSISSVQSWPPHPLPPPASFPGVDDMFAVILSTVSVRVGWSRFPAPPLQEEGTPALKAGAWLCTGVARPPERGQLFRLSVLAL